MQKVIGVTGGIGCGKTTISNFLHQKGAYIIDADKIGHKVILKGQKAYTEIINHFGKNILDTTTNEINRKALGEIVFSDKTKLLILNQITHKHIRTIIEQKINLAKKEGYFLIVLEMAILIEANFKDLVDEIWLVYTPLEERVRRITIRDNISPEMAKNIIKNQASFEELRPFADYIVNNENFEETKKSFNILFQKEQS